MWWLNHFILQSYFILPIRRWLKQLTLSTNICLVIKSHIIIDTIRASSWGWTVPCAFSSVNMLGSSSLCEVFTGRPIAYLFCAKPRNISLPRSIQRASRIIFSFIKVSFPSSSTFISCIILLVVRLLSVVKGFHISHVELHHEVLCSIISPLILLHQCLHVTPSFVIEVRLLRFSNLED